MKKQTLKIAKIISLSTMLFSLFIACSKKSDNGNIVVGGRPPIIGEVDCPTCPVTTNKIADALGVVGPGILQAEMGVSFYTEAVADNHVNIIGGSVTMSGYLFVDDDQSSWCRLSQGRYGIETLKAGQLNSLGNIENLEVRAIHPNGESVVLSFPFIGTAMLSPVKLSTIDNFEYSQYLNGQMIVGDLNGPQGQVICRSNALYLIGKPK